MYATMLVHMPIYYIFYYKLKYFNYTYMNKHYSRMTGIDVILIKEKMQANANNWSLAVVKSLYMQ